MQKNKNVRRADVARETAAPAKRRRADSAGAEMSIKKLQDHLNRCVSEITAYNTADIGKNEQLIATMGEQIRAEVATFASASRHESGALVRDLGERLERQFLANLKQHDNADENRAVILGQSIKEQVAKLGEIDCLASALGQRIDGLIDGLAEAERVNSASRTALVGSLENTVTTLVQKSHAESQSLTRILKGNLAELTDTTRAETAKMTGLIGSLDEKITTLAHTAHAHSEAAAKILHRTIEAHTRELEEKSRAQADKTTSFIQSLEKRIATSDEHSRREAAKAIALFEEKIAALGEKNKAELELVERALGQQIEHRVNGLTERTQAEASRTAALVGSLEHTVTKLAEKSREELESLTRDLGQEIAGHVLSLADNARATTAKSLGLIGTLEDKIAALAVQGVSQSESLARTLSQAIERHVSVIMESARAEAVAASALFESKIAALSGKVQAGTNLLANSLAQKIESSVCQLADNTKTDIARTTMMIGSLEAKITTMIERSFAESAAFAQQVTKQIEGQSLQLNEKIQTESAGTNALVGEKIAVLADSGKAHAESLFRGLQQKIDADVQKLAETARVEATKTTASVENMIAAAAEKTQADTQAVATALSQQLESVARTIAEVARTEAAKTATHVELLHETIMATAEKGRADSESLRQNLSQQIEAHTLEFAKSTRVEISNANTLFNQKFAALTEGGKAVSESLAQALSQKIETHVRELTANTHEVATRTTSVFESKIAGLADKSQTNYEALARTLSQQVASRSLELSESTRAEAAKMATLLENKIVGLAEQGRADTQDLARTLSLHIQTQGRELTEHTRAEAARGSVILEGKIAALAERGQAETVALAKELHDQIEGHVRELSELTRADVAKTTASIGSLEEKIAAFVQKNREALELQANALGAQLKIQLAELSEANKLQTTDLRKLLDTGLAAIERGATKSSETGRVEFQSRFNEIDEQSRRQLDELSQQYVVRTEAITEALRHRIDLGVTALVEGSRAESVAFESLLRTATEQIYRKVGIFTDGFQSEFENSHNKFDAIRAHIDLELDVLTKSSQEQFSRLTTIICGLVERLGPAEDQLSQIGAEHAEQAQSLRPINANGIHSYAPVNGHATITVSDPAEIITAQDSEPLAPRTHDAGTSGDANAAEANVGELVPTSGIKAVLSGRVDDWSDNVRTEDPFDPIIATPEKGLASDIEGLSKRRPQIGFARRWLGFIRTKH